MRQAIFITGAANGIGKETARLFHSKGWFIGLFDIDKKGLLSLIEEFGETKAVMIAGDVTSMLDLEQGFLHFTQKSGGRLDILFNNAGILRTGEFEEIPLEEQFRVLEINIRGVMNATHAALPYLKKTPDAQIINMCSASAFFGHPELTAYAASKAAVRSLTEGWSVGFEKYGIRVSDLQPIYVDTRMTRDNLDGVQGVSSSDIRLTPEKIASFVWKAHKRNRLHWPIGLDTRLFRFIMRFLPDAANRFILKKVIKYQG